LIKIIDAQKVREITNLSQPAVYKLISELEKVKILKEITGGKRGKVYLFDTYVNLFR
jgi:Fic family protein